MYLSLKSLLIWLLIVPLDILNGIFRELILIPSFGNYSLLISGIILIFLISILSILLIPKIGKGYTKDYIIIGFLWIFLTISFEFIFGITLGTPIPELIKAYDIRTGNIWSRVVIMVGFSPWLTAKIKRLI